MTGGGKSDVVEYEYEYEFEYEYEYDDEYEGARFRGGTSDF
jgi:hypothetical protein